MKLAKMLMTAAAAFVAVAPAMAVPANPAARLSVAKAVRAAAPANKGNQLAGGGAIIVIAAAVAVIAGVIIIADKSDSK